MELFETRDFLWPPRVLTRTREIIFIEIPLILPPPLHLILNITNPGTSADSGLFDGWGQEVAPRCGCVDKRMPGWGCHSGTRGWCQHVHNIFKTLQTQSVDKNINPQHAVSFGQISWRALQITPDLSSLEEFPDRAGNTVAVVHIPSWAIHCVSES